MLMIKDKDTCKRGEIIIIMYVDLRVPYLLSETGSL